MRPLLPAERATEQGSLELPVTVWPDNPRTALEPGEFHAYELEGAAGGVVGLRMRAAECGAMQPALYLFGPPQVDGSVPALAGAVSGSCEAGVAITDVELPVDGTYLVLATSHAAPGQYRLDAWCEAEPCRPARSLSWEASRSESVQSSDVGALDDIGKFLFRRVYRLADGLGNGRDGTAPPNMRPIHDGAFGGPDGQSCVSCHNLGEHGAGMLGDNIFQAGDGAHMKGALERNPPALRGLGVRQAIAAEMTAVVKSRYQALHAQAVASGTEASETLCVASGAVCFGALTVRPDGSVDEHALDGIDADLVVRPFGWKGREATLRGFVRGGFRVHFGMQSEETTTECVDAELYQKTWGEGACPDPDEDEVARELTKGQLDAVAIYLMLLPAPVPPAFDETGPELMGQMGCTSCHVRSLELASSILRDPDLEVDVDLPVSAGPIELWTDFKRHDMDFDLADGKEFFNAPMPDIPARVFITAPLWDLANTAPYLHDGRAPTIREAILKHAGTEAGPSRRNFEQATPAEQEALLAFLGSLGREAEE